MNIMEDNSDVSVGMEAYTCFNEALTIKPDGAFKFNKMNFLSVWGTYIILCRRFWLGNGES